MEKPDSNRKDEPKSPLAKAAYVGAMGFEFVGVVIGAFILGNWANDRFGIEPWGTVICLVAGMIAAGIHVYMIAKRFLLDEE